MIAEAQSPYTNLTHLAGKVGVRFPGDAADHSVCQRIWPARTASTIRFLNLNLDLRPLGGQTGDRGSYRFTIGHGAGSSPAIEVFIGSSDILSSDGDSPRSIRTLRPGTWYNVRLTLDLERRTYSGAIGESKDMTRFVNRSFASRWDGTIDTILIDGRGPVASIRPAVDIDNIAVREAPIRPVDPPFAPPGPDDRAQALAALIDLRDSELAYGVAEGTPHDVRIQKRGEPTKPGEMVSRRFLEVLGGDPLPPRR